MLYIYDLKDKITTLGIHFHEEGIHFHDKGIHLHEKRIYFHVKGLYFHEKKVFTFMINEFCWPEGVDKWQKTVQSST